MPPTTITQEDIETLRKNTSKPAVRAVNILLPLVILGFLVAGALNLHLCTRFSNLAGMSMTDTILSWFAGIDVSA